jgi:Tfp pilus assembly protein PilE
MTLHAHKGFTIVEILVIIATLGILATLTTVNYVNMQKQARDNQRMTSALVVSESLEKYFAQHGEYPTVPKVTNANANTVKQLLSIMNIDSLVGPQRGGGSTVNLWKTGVASTTNTLTYSPNTDTATSCTTGTTSSDACVDYRIQYYKEKTGAVESIYSRNRAVAAPAAPSAPGTPTLVVDINGTNVTATASGATCLAGTTAQYSFSSRTDDGTWSSFTAWSGTPTASTPAVTGVKYGYQVKANCTNGSQTSPDSATSSEAVYIHPISAPAAPVVSQSTAGTTTTFSVNTITCPAGTTAQVQYHLTTDWGYNGTWTAPLANTGTHIINTANQGYEYVDEAQARCTNSFATSPWSASGTASYISPVTPPGGASNYVATMNAGATQLAWSFTRPTCHSSVTPAIYWNIYVDNGWTYNGASGWIGWRTAIVTNTNMTQTVTLSPTSAPTFSSGGRSAITTEWYCINQTTDRQSTIGPRVQSTTYTYTP